MKHLLIVFLLLAGAASVAAEPRPLPAAQCAALGDALEAEMRLASGFAVTEAADADMAPLETPRACRLEFAGTGAQFERESRAGVAQATEAFREALQTAGWVETQATAPYAADGPLAARFGVAKGYALCVAEVEMAANAAGRRYRLRVDCVDGLER